MLFSLAGNPCTLKPSYCQREHWNISNNTYYREVVQYHNGVIKETFAIWHFVKNFKKAEVFQRTCDHLKGKINAKFEKIEESTDYKTFDYTKCIHYLCHSSTCSFTVFYCNQVKKSTS